MRAWLVVVAGLAGCMHTNSVQCSDGTVCAEGTTCDVANHRCLSPAETAPCDGQVEGAMCDVDGRPGSCHGGACDIFYCGDQAKNATEQCDGTDLGVDPSTASGLADCTTLGFYGPGALACDSSCRYDITGCRATGYCGDGIVNGPELCDGPTNRACIAVGFDAGSISCNTECTFNIRDCSRFGWTPESLTDVVALAVGGSAPNDEWAVGLQGGAMHYEGEFWNFVPTGATSTLDAVWSISKSDAWIVGENATVLHWDGSVWNAVQNVPSATYRDVWAAGSSAVFIASDSGVLAWNGTAWQTNAVAIGATTYHPIAIRGTTASDMWLATSEGDLLHGDGTSWAVASPANSQVHFIDANAVNDVWVVGYDSRDLGTALAAHWDGTAWTTWRETGAAYNNIASSAPNDAWIAGVDGVMRHFDGVAWSSTLSIAPNGSGAAGISGFFSFSPSEVVAVSTLGIAYRYRGQTFGRFPTFGPDPFTAVPNTAVWSAAANDTYVTDVQGEIWHFDGTAWSVVFQVPQTTGTVAANSVWGSGASDVYVAASDGNVYHFDGTTWTTDNVTSTALTIVTGTSAANQWAFGVSGAWHHSGGTWTRFALTNLPVLAASGSGASDIWAVEAAGANHTLWHYNGTAWAKVTTGATTPLATVLAIAPNDVFVAAAGGRIEHWNGSVWNEVIVPSIAELQFLAASAGDDVIAASERDLFHYDGVQWSPMRPPIDFVPNTPDYVPMAALAVTPGRVDMLMQKFRIRTLIRTRPITCRPHETNCSDGVDDDCDGLIDKLDPDCP